MDEKIFNLDTMENKDRDNNTQQELKPGIATNKDDQNTIRIKAVDIKPTQNSTEQNASNDKACLDTDETEGKKDLNDYSNDVATHLKSEYTRLAPDNKAKQAEMINLPSYTEINMTECSCYSNNKGSRRRYNKSPYLKEPMIMIQLMGSEKIREDREPMEYDPEEGYKSVKAMFLNLMLLHLFTFFALCIPYAVHVFFKIFEKPLHQEYRSLLTFVYEVAIMISIVCVVLYVFLVILAACTARIRGGFCVMTCTALAVLLKCIAMIFMTAYGQFDAFICTYFTLTIMDIIFGFVGMLRSCGMNDYTSWTLYPVIIGFGAIFVIAFFFIMKAVRPAENVTMAYIIYAVYTFVSIIIIAAELQHLLGGGRIELEENDFTFASFLMYVSIVDFPIRMLRKIGVCDKCEPREVEQAKEESSPCALF